MADKKLSSVNAVSDMNFVYAETSTGETVKISKADLASVVAEVIGINNTWLRDRGALGSSVDLNTILTPGVYRISNNSFISYKMMIVFKGDTYTVQLFFGIGANDKSLRMRNYYNGEWSTLYNISLT